MTLTGSDGFVTEEDLVGLSCTSTGGHPSPTTFITREGTILSSGPSPISHTFTASAADHNAVYFCYAENSAGNKTTSLSFDVSCKAE